MKTTLDRFIPRQPGYAIEVLIGTGELAQAVRLHYRHDQRVVAEQSGLLCSLETTTAAAEDIIARNTTAARRFITLEARPTLGWRNPFD
jgi:hypothetical protein